MSRQDQSVSEGGMAIQAGGSVVVNAGVGPDQMAEIMIGLANQLALYQADAQRTVNERLQRFREEIIHEFSRPERANPESFRDPDFQYLLNRAQHAYARIGEKELGETLVQMVADRSKCMERGRLSLTLNKAVEIAADLTVNEFAELALLFVITQTMNHGVRDISSFKIYFEQNISPLLRDISMEHSSYTYLASQGCGTLSSLGTTSLTGCFKANYGGIFCSGFELAELSATLEG